MSRHDALIARIKKCLALAASANEHEAAAALAKARALMDEHGLSEADIAMSDIAEAAARGTGAQRPPRWESTLSQAVCRALSVSAFLNGEGGRTFVGVGPAAEIAAYAFAALFRRLKAARAEYCRTKLRRVKPGRKRQRADIFCEGWAIAVHSEIAKLAPGPLDPRIGTYLAERHPGLATVTPRVAAIKGARAFDDWVNGQRAGDGVRLHHGVGGSGHQAQLA